MNEATLRNMTDEEFDQHLYMENPSDLLLQEVIRRAQERNIEEESAQERVDEMESEVAKMSIDMEDSLIKNQDLSEALDTAIDELSKWPESDPDVLADLRETRRANGT